jgi:HEPN domain-containing protein
MKQTAVEWLEKQFVKLESTIGVHGVMYEFIEQAKSMENEQIITVYWDAYNEGKYRTDKTAEEYYKETFIT